MNEDIKIQALNAHDSLRLVLYQLEHLRSDFANGIIKKGIGIELIETLDEQVKTIMSDAYLCADFLHQVFLVDDIDSLKTLIEDFKSKSAEFA